MRSVSCSVYLIYCCKRTNTDAEGKQDVYSLSGEYDPNDPRFQNDSDCGEEEEEEEEWEEEEEEDALVCFDGHEGVSGDFTKTFKAEISGCRPNSAATQVLSLFALLVQTYKY